MRHLALLLLLVPFLPPSLAAQGEPVRLQTFNIRYGTANDGPNAWPHRKDLVVERIRAAKAHVVGLQEVLASQLAELKAALPEFRFVGEGRGGGAVGEHAPVLVDERRFTIEGSGQFWLSTTPAVVGSKGWDAALPRICTWVIVRDRNGGAPFAVLNTHFDHRGERARVESARLLARLLGQFPFAVMPRVVMGDFNAGEDSDAMRALFDAGLRDTFRVAHPTAVDVGTFHGFRGTRTGAKIDGILVDASFTVVDAAIDTTLDGGRAPSDHFPVTATVK